MNSPSNCEGSVRPLYPITLLFIHSRSASDNSPSHILFSICPYAGSAVKRCALSNIIITLMQLIQWLLDELENMRSDSVVPTGSSCRKSPANMIENPPKGLVLLFPMPAVFYPVLKDFITHE